MKKEIYIIRHGQTDYNKKKIVQGSGIDSNLSGLGKAQANAFFKKYKDIAFDIVYTSTLKRAIQSVNSFIKDKSIPHKSLSELNEISWGVNEGKTMSKANNDYFNYMLAEWKKGNLEVAVENGETPIEVQTRQKEALKHILDQEEEKKILICMHGRAMRIFLCLMLDHPLKDMDRFEHSNLCLYKLTYENSSFQLEEAYNTAHLSELVSA